MQKFGTATSPSLASNRCSDTLHIRVELAEETLGTLRQFIQLLEDKTRLESRSSADPTLSHPNSIPRPSNLSPYLDAKAAAAYLGTTVGSLYGLVDRRQIEPLRGPRRRYRFTQAMLDEYLKQGRRK